MSGNAKATPPPSQTRPNRPETTAAGATSSASADRASGLLRRFFHEWVAPRWKRLTIALILTALLAAVTGAYPMIIKLSFDTLMASGENGATAADNTVLMVLAAIVVITITRAILLYSQTVVSIGIVQRMMTDLQKLVFSRMIDADFATQTRDPPGRWVSKLTNDITFIQNAVQATLNTAVRDVMMVIALVASMFYLDWMMSLLVLCVYPFAAIPIAIISERLRKVAKRTQNELGGMTSLLTEKLSGSRLIKTFRLESYAKDQVNDSFEEVLRLRMKAVRNRARLDPMLEAFGGLAVAGVIAFAYWRISTGVSTVGDFMGFVTALLMAAQPIRGIGNLSGKIQEGLAAAESVYAVIDEPRTVIDEPGARPLAISHGAVGFDNVSFNYASASDAPAVSNVTLDIPGGTTMAFVGRSGAGKSTIINLVPRLFEVTSGHIRVDGQDIREVTLESLRSAISIVSQDVTLFDDTIRANIALGRLGADDDAVIAAAKAAAAHDFIMAQPEGYDTRIGDRGLRLSGGQRQRLALARAILKDAPILLLDEATSALDTESEKLVQEALNAFTKDRTTLVIAHRLSTVRNADAICVMEAGRVIEVGTHDGLMAKGGAYAALARAQALTGGEASGKAHANDDADTPAENLTVPLTST